MEAFYGLYHVYLVLSRAEDVWSSVNDGPHDTEV